MALTISVSNKMSFGNKKMYSGTITFDNSYAGSGGEVYTNAQFALRVIEELVVSPKDGYVFEVDLTNKKIIVREQSPAATSSGPLSEVTATDDLSSVAPRFLAIGYGG
jgi:hypothetical protein